jgi:hypothetical protein
MPTAEQIAADTLGFEIAAVFVIALVLRAYRRYRSLHPHNINSGANTNSQLAQPAQHPSQTQCVQAIRGAENGNNKPERLSRRARKYLGRMFVACSDYVGRNGVTLFTAVLAGVAYLQWRTLDKTDHTLQETLAANKLSQRAWVSVEMDLNGPFTYSVKDGAEIRLHVTMKNVGHELMNPLIS